VSDDFAPGMWWSPGQQARALVGELSRHRDGSFRLATVGMFGSQPIPDGQPIPMIHGVNNKSNVSLLGVRPIGSHFESPGGQRATYLIERMLIGAHVAVNDRLDELLVEPTFLQDWLGYTGIEQDRRRRDVKQIPTAIIYRWPKSFRVEVAGGAVITVEARQSTLPSRGSIALEEHLRLRVKLRRALPIDTLISDFAQPLLQFVSLATARANTFRYVGLRSPKHAIRVRPRKLYRRDIELRAQWLDQAVPDVPSGLLRPQQQLFTLTDCESTGIGTLLPRWLELQTEIRDCLVAYFALVFAPPGFTNTQLVILAQALEAYHRARHEQRLIPKAEFRRIRDAMVAVIPDDRRALFEPRLAFLNERSQRDRLNHLVSLQDGYLPGLFLHQAAFVDELVLQRNREAHPSPDRREPPLSPMNLFRVVTTARYLLQSCFLRELGFSQEKTASFFSRNDEYGHFVGRLGSGFAE
jgi:ApeA N-terminal domain 1